MLTPKELQVETNREMLTQLRIDVAVMKDRTEDLPELVKSVIQVETNVKWLQRGLFGVIPILGVVVTAIMGYFGITGK